MRRDGGQATVEVALLLPLTALLLLGVVQVALVAARQVAVTHAAREAARVAAAGGTDEAARQAAERATGLAAGALELEVVRSGGDVRATASYRDPTDVPLVGPLLPPVVEAASVSFRLEDSLV